MWRKAVEAHPGSREKAWGDVAAPTLPKGKPMSEQQLDINFSSAALHLLWRRVGGCDARSCSPNPS